MQYTKWTGTMLWFYAREAQVNKSAYGVISCNRSRRDRSAHSVPNTQNHLWYHV